MNRRNRVARAAGAPFDSVPRLRYTRYIYITAARSSRQIPTRSPRNVGTVSVTARDGAATAGMQPSYRNEQR